MSDTQPKVMTQRAVWVLLGYCCGNVMAGCPRLRSVFAELSNSSPCVRAKAPARQLARNATRYRGELC